VTIRMERDHCAVGGGPHPGSLLPARLFPQPG